MDGLRSVASISARRAKSEIIGKALLMIKDFE